MRKITPNTQAVWAELSRIMHAIYDTADKDWMMEHTARLGDLEAKQTFPYYEKAAEYICQLIKDSGIEPQLIEFPADGKTSYQDKCMPLAWDATVGRLTVKKSPVTFDDPVIADFEKLPIHLVKGSVATPAGGIDVRVVTEEQVYAGEDCTGAIVLIRRARQKTIQPILDLGAIGFISDYLLNPIDKPHDVYWCNAATDKNGWNVVAEDRDFIGFSISPYNGQLLRRAATEGDVIVHVESDGRRYEGKLPMVTALIPGKQKRELWMLAHTSEPFAVDNALGVVTTIAVVKKLQELIANGTIAPLEFSIRMVFAMEVHGFAAAADYFGGCLRDRALGAINIDAPFGGKFNQIAVFYAPLAVPFYGNFINKFVAEVYDREFHTPEVVDRTTSYIDDMSLSDATNGLPTVWPIGEHVNEKGEVDYHHNSSWDNSFLDAENCARSLAYYATWTAVVATMHAAVLPNFLQASKELAEAYLQAEAEKKTTYGTTAARMAFLTQAMQAALGNYGLAVDDPQIDTVAKSLEVPKSTQADVPDSVWLTYADRIVPKRLQPGFPFDLRRVPEKERRPLPEYMIYGHFAYVLSAMDGKKTLKQAIYEAVWEYPKTLTEKTIKSYIDTVMYFADWGYIAIENKVSLDKAMILSSLKKLGIREGDLLLVHSSLSKLGHIEGGANTVIDALLEAVGENGTILMPAFTIPYLAFEGELSKDSNYRPFAPEFADNLFTGTIPKVMLHRPGVLRSAHVTHSWCGMGKQAEYCLSAHGPLDPPVDGNSPLAKALELGGRVLFFGCDIGSNTFLHFLEDQADAPYLENAVVKCADKNGKLRTEVIHKHLPGHRSFYEKPGAENRFYRIALEKGLQIAQTELGIGKLQMMQLQQLYEIGTQMFREDPLATLCDNPNCRFCQKYRKQQ